MRRLLLVGGFSAAGLLGAAHVLSLIPHTNPIGIGVPLSIAAGFLVIFPVGGMLMAFQGEL